MSVAAGILNRHSVRFAAMVISLILMFLGTSFEAPPVSAASPGIDLIVQDIALSPSNPAIDDNVTITVTLKNQGVSAAGPSYVVCYTDAVILETQSVEALNPGMMVTRTFTWQAQAGSHTIRAVADSTEAIAESDETNNTKTFTLSTLAPDLVIESITWEPQNPSRFDEVTFSVNVKNRGNYESGPSGVHLSIDGESQGYRNLLAIAPGGTASATYSWYAQDGSHNIDATVDETDFVRESDETNNDFAMVFSTAAPDLIIQDITWTPQSPIKNDPVTWSVTVKNQGTGRADSCFVGYYIDEVYQTAIKINALESGASTTISIEFTATSSTHQLRAIADIYMTVPESNEDNNERTASMATTAPNLVVNNITWDVPEIVVGDTITFTVIIKNDGGGRADAFRAGYRTEGQPWSYLDIDPLDPGEAITVTFPQTATSGVFSVSFFADIDKIIAESNEYDNLKTRTVSAATLSPDLYISSIDWEPNNPGIGETVTFTVTIENQGEGNADSCHLGYYLDDAQMSSEAIPPLAAGESISRTFTWTAQNGRHVMKAAVDINKHISETDEANNEKSVTVVPLMPDLTINKITWTPANITVGEEITFNIDIVNTGTLQADFSHIGYYIDDEFIGYGDIEPLGPGATVTTYFRWVASAGPHTVDAIADSNDEVTEIDEANNSRHVNLPPPDLTIEIITRSPEEASIGDTVRYTVTVRNRGDGLSEDTLITCYIDGEPLETKALPGIAAGQSAEVWFEWVSQSGGHDIRVVVDPEDVITETDETNNDTTTNFSTLTPDLIIEDFTWLMENPLINDEVIFTVVIKNQGADISYPSRLRYVIDGDINDYEQVPAVASGEAFTLTFMKSLEAGSHSVLGTIDAADDVEEIDETNNEFTLNFTNIVPDLTVKSITLSPAGAAPGDRVTVTIKVENRGRKKVLNTRVTLSVDGSWLDSAEIEEIDVGAIVSCDLSWMAEGGSHEFLASIDPQGLVIESNEANNEKTRLVSVEEPETPMANINPANQEADSGNGSGLLNKGWWLFLLAALLLGGTAFVVTFRAIRKQ